MKCVNSDRNLEAENPRLVTSDPVTLEQGGSNTAVTRKLTHCCDKKKVTVATWFASIIKLKTVHQSAARDNKLINYL